MHHRYQASIAHHHCDNATTTAAAAAAAVGTDDPGSDVDMNCAALIAIKSQRPREPGSDLVQSLSSTPPSLTSSASIATPTTLPSMSPDLSTSLSSSTSSTSFSPPMYHRTVSNATNASAFRSMSLQQEYSSSLPSTSTTVIPPTNALSASGPVQVAPHLHMTHRRSTSTGGIAAESRSYLHRKPKISLEDGYDYDIEYCFSDHSDLVPRAVLLQSSSNVCVCVYVYCVLCVYVCVSRLE
jgi:hypothetical protein